MDISDLERKLGIDGISAEQQMEIITALQQSAAEKIAKAKSESIGKGAELVIQGLKKIRSDMEQKFALLNTEIQSKVSAIQDGRDGKDGKDGRDGKQGPAGETGPRGRDGVPGRDGVDGANGTGVASARIDFDGSLIIVFDDGREVNAGEVVPFDIAERIKVITNGGGTSQYVLDTLTSLQNQINAISGGLDYQGTWNASTNSPALASGVGTTNYYYIVGTSGSTNLDGITDWVAGDWLIFNGTVWQKIDQTNLVSSVNGQTGAVSLTYTNVNAIGSITSVDGSVTVSTASGIADLSVAVAASTTTVIAQVRNTTGATLTKGTVVYISGATGQISTVTKALASGDSTSAQTLGVISADLANNTNGYVTIIGLVTDIDTSAYTDGQQLYLSPTTAGTYTATKPYAPNHLVYVAIVEYAHAIHGKLFVKVQNGYELDELHNVSAQNPTNGQTLIYNESTSLWEKHTLTAGTGIDVANGAGSITIDLESAYGDTLNPYASKTAKFFLAAPNGTSGVPTFRAMVASDVPTLNQNTTGSAGSVATTNFSIEESGGKLLFKYGATTIASMSSTGVITSATNIVANGTP